MNKILLLISLEIFMYLVLVVMLPKGIFDEHKGAIHLILILFTMMITCLIGGLIL
jgi:hypothetical protein